MFGKYIPVNAEVKSILGLSGHADQKELIDWMGKITPPPEKVFIVHGEPQASDSLRVKIKDTYGWKSRIPGLFDICEI